MFDVLVYHVDIHIIETLRSVWCWLYRFFALFGNLKYLFRKPSGRVPLKRVVRDGCILLSVEFFPATEVWTGRSSLGRSRCK